MLDKILKKIKNKTNLSIQESREVFSLIITGKVNNENLEEFLINLSDKGETIDEITGGVMALREKCKNILFKGDLIDTCGTGGDGKNTINISSAVAIVLSANEVKVAKHGNKNISSKCGSANVFEMLGIDINLDEKGVVKSLEENNFAFMFAPNFHPAMKYVAEVRKKIGKRTIFNLLGPLLNPVNVNRQIIGVFSKDILKKYIYVLKNLRLTKAWVFHSQDGLDEISIFANTDVYELNNGKINQFEVIPSKILKTDGNIKDIIGDDAEYNKNKILDVFSGSKNALLEIIALNSAAALVVCEKENNLKTAYEKMYSFISSGNVIKHLNKITK